MPFLSHNQASSQEQRIAVVPQDTALNIISYLPWDIQLRVCRESRSRILPSLETAANTIKRCMIGEKSRVMQVLHGEAYEYESPEILCAAHSLYQPLNAIQLDRTLAYVLRYRHSRKFPVESQLTIIHGRRLGWSAKKTYRHMMTHFKVSDFIVMGW